MKKSNKNYTIIVFVLCLVLVSASIEAGDVCKGYEPQAPRDIDNRAGENKSNFSLAPNYTELNLCDLHFHVNAEHKAKVFQSMQVMVSTALAVVINAMIVRH